MPKNKKKSNKNNKKVVNKAQVVKEAPINDEPEVVEEVKEVKKEDKKVSKKTNKKQDKKIEKEAKKQKRWFKDFKAELKKMVWPSGKELWENTAVVLSSVIIVALVIFALDSAFNGLSQLEVEGIKKIQNTTTVSTDSNEIVEETSEEESTESESENAQEFTTEESE